MIVSLAALHKTYEDRQQRVTAVDNISLEVKEGELFGLLGPNGAGKTTTIGICTTRTRPTSGSVVIAGVDVVKHPAQARQHIGVVPQYNTLDRSLTLYENLYYHCLYFGLSAQESRERAEALLRQFLLYERRKATPRQLSGGQQQRVQIARAIAHRPSVLFLDEPSAGLDPQSRLAMWEIVQKLRDEGITVVLTTHYMEEADELCERIAIIDHGKLLAIDTPAQLKQKVGADRIFTLKLTQKAPEDLQKRFALLPAVSAVEPTAEGLRLFLIGADKDSGQNLPQIVQMAEPYGICDLAIEEPSLEAVFIRLTGRDLRE